MSENINYAGVNFNSISANLSNILVNFTKRFISQIVKNLINTEIIFKEILSLFEEGELSSKKELESIISLNHISNKSIFIVQDFNNQLNLWIKNYEDSLKIFNFFEKEKNNKNLNINENELNNNIQNLELLKQINRKFICDDSIIKKRFPLCFNNEVNSCFKPMNIFMDRPNGIMNMNNNNFINQNQRALDNNYRVNLIPPNFGIIPGSNNSFINDINMNSILNSSLLSMNPKRNNLNLLYQNSGNQGSALNRSNILLYNEISSHPTSEQSTNGISLANKDLTAFNQNNK